MHSIAIVVSRLGRLITVVAPRSYLKERIVFKDCHSVGKTLLILLCAIELLGQEFGQTCGGDENKVFIFSQTHAMFLVLGHDGRAIIDSISLMVLIRHYNVLQLIIFQSARRLTRSKRLLLANLTSVLVIAFGSW